MVFAIICFVIVGLIIWNFVYRLNFEQRIYSNYDKARLEIEKNPFDEKAFQQFILCAKSKYLTRFRNSSEAEKNLATSKFVDDDIRYVYALRNKIINEKNYTKRR